MSIDVFWCILTDDSNGCMLIDALMVLVLLLCVDCWSLLMDIPLHQDLMLTVNKYSCLLLSVFVCACLTNKMCCRMIAGCWNMWSSWVYKHQSFYSLYRWKILVSQICSLSLLGINDRISRSTASLKRNVLHKKPFSICTRAKSIHVIVGVDFFILSSHSCPVSF